MLDVQVESGWDFSKRLVTATHGIVAAKHPLAARVGLTMLRQGGNAVDAAVAAAFAVGVVEPWASGLGGAGVLIIASPQRLPVVVDCGVRAPAAARADMYALGEGYDQEASWWRAVRGEANIHGALSVAVPGVPAGLATALARFGTMSLNEVLRPSITIARDGFPIQWTTLLHIAMDAPTLRRYPAAASLFLPNGTLPTISSVGSPQLLRQPELARTLEAIAADGPDAFYKGDIAQHIVAEVQRGGGVLTAEDLARYCGVTAPASVHMRANGSVALAPGPHAGETLAAAVAILDAHSASSYGHNTADYLHFLIEATHAAVHDRLTRLGDDDPMGVPSTGTVMQQGRISKEQATPWRLPRNEPTSTTQLCVIDQAGTAVSLTQTLLSWFGSRVLVPGTGVVLNNGMMWFDPVPGRPNSVGSGKRPVSNMTPVVAISDGEPILAAGASGGRRIAGSVLQVMLNVMDFGMDVQRAIAAPRIDASDVRVLMDHRIPASVRLELVGRGHDIAVVEEQVWPRYFASPVALARDVKGQMLHGGVDPYHPAIAVGY